VNTILKSRRSRTDIGRIISAKRASSIAEGIEQHRQYRLDVPQSLIAIADEAIE
jgi:hypothetical protein